jgi:hypothetical protein
MNLHIVKWDEESALWRTRVLNNVDPNQPMIKINRGNQPWLAWNTPGCRHGLAEYVDLESVAATISPAGDILLYYRPALEYWRHINLEAACHVEWLEREWPTFGEVALEELNNIAQAISRDARIHERGLQRCEAGIPENDEG